MLIALRDYIKHYKLVSSEQLTREFKIAMEALEPILDIWITKKIISKIKNFYPKKKI